MRTITDKGGETFLGRTWHFLWKSDSIWSWLVDLALLYLIVKFIFFPLLSLTFGTALPSVIVESSSMHHTGDIDGWWRSYGWWYEQKELTKEQVSQWDFMKGINKGDIIVVFGVKNISMGDVIIYNAGQQKPIIHRVVSLNPIQTKGDNNQGQLQFEYNIKQEQVIGKAVLRIPKLGWIKLVFVEIFKLGK